MPRPRLTARAFSLRRDDADSANRQARHWQYIVPNPTSLFFLFDAPLVRSLIYMRSLACTRPVDQPTPCVLKNHLESGVRGL